MITDFITGKQIPDIGAEGNRQRVARYLVEERGFARTDICVDAPVEFSLGGEIYRSVIDLVVHIDQRPAMLVKCAAGSLGSRERETLAAARIYQPGPIPISIVSDGDTAIVMDTTLGKTIGKGMADIPTKNQLESQLKHMLPPTLSPKQLKGERLIFRSYDSMNVNVARKVPQD
jgi:hypothetical protein